MADLYLVRHGQTELNVQNILQGGHDSPLTARGREQALATRAAFEARGVTFDRVYSSPLGRARHTAELIAGEGCSIELVDDLREWHLGSLEGTSNREMPPQPGVIIRWPLVASLKASSSRAWSRRCPTSWPGPARLRAGSLPRLFLPGVS
ncbi:MAG: histidine phosphatase family protein [Collinsella sp.]